MTDYTDITKNTVYAVPFNAPTTCDTTKWKTDTACNGITKPWAFGNPTQYNAVGPVKGSVRAWHYLGDVGSDFTKVWSIEKADVLNILLYEFVDKQQGAAATGAQWGSTGSYAWYVASYTVAGATSTMLGTAALIAGIATQFF